MQEVLESNSHLTTHLVEDIAGIETIKLFAAEEPRIGKGEGRILALVQSVFALQTLEIRVQSLAMLVTGLASVAVLWFGGHRVIAGALSVGELLFFYTLLLTMLEPLNRLAMVNLKLQDALVAVDRLFQILDLETERSAVEKIPFTDLKSRIEFRDIGFSYGNRTTLFQTLNLSIEAGQTVAVVGESGSGKSTLLKLLLAEYQPSAGQVLLDGIDIRDFSLESLRRRIAVVSQDPYIFNGTIRENLSLADEHASFEEIVAAARAAGLEEFINGLPQRWETLIGERGVNLSGGQRQRLAIALASWVIRPLSSSTRPRAISIRSPNKPSRRACGVFWRAGRCSSSPTGSARCKMPTGFAFCGAASSWNKARATSCWPPVACSPACGRPKHRASSAAALYASPFPRRFPHIVNLPCNEDLPDDSPEPIALSGRRCPFAGDCTRNLSSPSLAVRRQSGVVELRLHVAAASARSPAARARTRRLLAVGELVCGRPDLGRPDHRQPGGAFDRPGAACRYATAHFRPARNPARRSAWPSFVSIRATKFNKGSAARIRYGATRQRDRGPRPQNPGMPGRAGRARSHRRAAGKPIPGGPRQSVGGVGCWPDRGRAGTATAAG